MVNSNEINSSPTAARRPRWQDNFKKTSNQLSGMIRQICHLLSVNRLPLAEARGVAPGWTAGWPRYGATSAS